MTLTAFLLHSNMMLVHAAPVCLLPSLLNLSPLTICGRCNSIGCFWSSTTDLCHRTLVLRQFNKYIWVHHFILYTMIHGSAHLHLHGGSCTDILVLVLGLHLLLSCISLIFVSTSQNNIVSLLHSFLFPFYLLSCLSLAHWTYYLTTTTTTTTTKTPFSLLVVSHLVLFSFILSFSTLFSKSHPCSKGPTMDMEGWLDILLISF